MFLGFYCSDGREIVFSLRNLSVRVVERVIGGVRRFVMRFFVGFVGKVLLWEAGSIGF